MGQFLQVAFDVKRGLFCSNYSSVTVWETIFKLVSYLQTIDVALRSDTSTFHYNDRHPRRKTRETLSLI